MDAKPDASLAASSLRNGSAAPRVVQPTSEIDWAKVEFKLYPSNGYIKYICKNGNWDKGEFIKEPYITLHHGSTLLNYGQTVDNFRTLRRALLSLQGLCASINQVFEGASIFDHLALTGGKPADAFRRAQMKAYRFKDGTVRLFRPHENAARINHSASLMDMPPLPEEIFLEACKRCVSANLEYVSPYSSSGKYGALYIRPVYFGSGTVLNLLSPDEFTFMIWCTATGPLYGASGTDIPGVDALIPNDFDRTAPLGSGSGKLGGNYSPAFKNMRVGKKAGFPILLFLDSATRTYIDEFATSNCLLLSYANEASAKEEDKLKNATIYIPQSRNILKGIVTMSMAEMASKLLGWNIKTTQIPFADLKANKFDEMVATGTAAVITPVRSVTYYTSATDTAKIEIGNGFAGPGFVHLMNMLTSIQSGDAEDTLGWMWPKEGIEPPQ
ncbi:MAG: hypothetical protein CYPHOPRED_001072 [Cyphobasidiales sp. Tagirdzhanova-0007]|nr:MAG: hypothetical protein CYPHOPRED_001072 [Cyphobasidiales sp. Tagirdzhanova-0007]